MPPFRRTLALTTVAAVLATGSAVVGSGPVRAAETAAGDLVLPARFPGRPAYLVLAGTSAEALAYDRVDPSLEDPVAYVRSSASTEHRALPGWRAHAVDGAWVSLYKVREPGTVRLLHAGTGATRDIQTSRTTEQVLPLADGGWVELLWRPGDDHRLLQVHAPDGAQRTEVDLGRAHVSSIEFDGVGAIARVTPFFSSQYLTKYADFGTGSVRTLQSLGRGCDVALTATALAFCDDQARLVRVDRRSFATRTVRTLPPDSIGSVAITESATAWYSEISGAGRLQTSREASPTVVTVVQAPLQGAYQRLLAAGDRFATQGGADARTRGIYAFSAGSTGFSAALDLLGPGAPRALAAAPGRLVLTEESGRAPRVRLVEQRLSRADPGTMTVAAPEQVLATTFSAPHLSGSFTSYDDQRLDGKQEVVVLEGTDELARVITNGSTESWNGHRLLLREYVPSPTGVGSVPRARLVDLRAGQDIAVEEGAKALWASTLAAVTPDGAITVRDLDVPGSTTAVRAAGLPPTSSTAPLAFDIKLAGDWVAWTVTAYSSSGSKTLEAVARNTATGAELTLPGEPEQLRLAADRLAWVDRTTRQVQLLDLRDGLQTALGQQAHPHLWTAVLALDTEFVAWADEQGRTIVRALAVRDQAPTLLGGLLTPRFSARTGLRPRLAVDRPVDAVTLQVRDSTGALVASVSGSAPGGALSPAWDTRLPDGTAAPAGSYTWELTGTDGTHVVAPTASTPLSGTSVLDRTSPSARLSVPAHASDAGSGPGFVVGIASDDPTARFRVDVSQRALTATGTWTAQPARLWFTTRTAGNYRFGGGLSPFPLTPGSWLTFTVTAQDEAGNRTSKTGHTLIPLDDRERLLRYSSGWVSGSTSDHWAGTYRETQGAGRTVAFTGTFRRLVLIGTKCDSCGRVRVVLDGRTVKTIDTRGTYAARKVLLDLTAGTTPGRHTVTLVNEGTAGRPRLRVDAIALVG